MASESMPYGSSSTGVQPEFDRTIIGKAQKMHNKTLNARTLCQIPSTEQIVQDYKTMGGRLWITPNYFLYTSALYKPLKFAFSSVEHIELVGNKITVNYRGPRGGTESTYFSLIKASEAFTVMQYLIYNPCTYLSLEQEDHGHGHGSSSSSTTGRVIDTFLSLSLPKVDVDSAAEGVRNIDDAIELGVSTLEELAKQAETIDRIHHTAKNIGANLDSADRYIRGFSFGGGLRNLVTRNPARRNHPSFKYMCRDVILASKAPEILQFSILLKRADDSLVPVGLRFTPKYFEVFDPITEEVLRPLCWSYAQLEQIRLRARPLHIDLRFDESTPRFRMLTSYCQAITNELFLRSLAEKHEPEVLFEPNVPVFDYGSHRLTIVQGMDRTPGDPANPFKVAKCASLVVSGRPSDILVGADEATKKDYDEQQYLVGEIFSKSKDLQRMAEAIGKELDSSKEQIEKATSVIKDNTVHCAEDNRRVQGLLR